MQKLASEPIFQPRRLLAALDEASLADDAIAAVLTLADKFEAGVEFVHAVRPPGPALQVFEVVKAVARGRDPLEPVIARTLERVRAAFAHAGRSGSGIDEHVHVVQGHPAQVILERARASEADLIVMGALRRRTFIDFGSTARAVLTHARCPVWIQPGPVAPIRNILVPYDHSSDSAHALTAARELARKFGASILALHCFESLPLASSPAWGGYLGPDTLDEFARACTDEFTNAMRAFDWQGVPHEHRFTEGSVVETILEFAEKADLVVMGSHGRTRLASALLGSVAYGVLKGSTRPVMIVRDAVSAYKLT
ncbi:MAG: universal stress protein [Planctomycetes bacterium]|nr:universal stress protein [Planctomycetota bacterium]